LVPVDYLLDQRNPVNIVNRLSAAYAGLKEELEKTVVEFSDVLQYSGGKIDMSKELKEKVDRYDQALKELKSSLPDVEKALKDKFGNYVVVSNGQVDLAPELKKTVDRLNEFALMYNSIVQDYNSALFDLVKRYGLKIEGNTLVVPPDKYDQVKAELDALNKKHNETLDKLYSQYKDLFNRRVVDGRVVYELKPETQAALVLQGQVAETVKDLVAAQQKALQDVVGKYSDVLTYDPKTGRVAPSKELEEMMNRYTQAAQEVGKLINAMNTVASMIPAFAQNLPVFTVKFQTYDKATNQWVETGGETPIYVRDEKMREEIRRWMEQNRDKVKAAAFYDLNRPVVYIFNDRDEGYIINPATGEARRARGVSGMVDDTAKALWYKSLTDEEKKELERWLEVQRRKEELGQLPPAARDLYAALLGAGRFAVVAPAVDVLSRWLRGEDPTEGLRKFELEAAAAAEASPLAHAVGQAVGLLGVAGLGAETLIARGAAAGAQGVGRQLLAGLRSVSKPAAAGAVAGAAFGAVEGALTGRDPLAEAFKFGTIGFLTGLGGVTREQLIAGGLLGGLVGASTAKKYGVEEGLEAGSAVFLLPIAAPVEKGIGGITMGTAGRRPAATLKTESAADPRYAQIVRELAAQIRSGMAEVKPEPGLTPSDAAFIAAQLRRNPAEQRAFFQNLAEDALMKMRAGVDADVVLTQLRLIRQKLDTVSRMRFDEVLRQYGLAEVKTAVPEYRLTEESATALNQFLKTRTPKYALRDEDAPALDRLFRRDFQREPEYSLRGEDAAKLAKLFRREPEYALTDESAKLLDTLFKQRQESQYALTDEAAQRLNQFLKMREPEYSLRGEDAAALARVSRRDMQRAPEYALTDEAAALLDQFLKMGKELAFSPLVAEQQPAARRRVRHARQKPKPKDVLTARTEVELARQTEPVLARRLEPEVSAGRRPWLEPALTARAEIQLSTRETGAEVGRPEVQNALVHALKPKAETVPEAALAPEVRQAFEWAQEAGRRLAELGEIINSPRVVQLLQRKEPPEEERRTAIPILPILQAESPRAIKPWTSVLKTSEDEPKYNPPLLTQPTTLTTADVPPTPTYTPVTVPQISEVPTLDVPTVPTTVDVPTVPTTVDVPTVPTTVDVPTVPTTVDVPTVPTYETTPEPLPPGWWRLLSPSLFTEGSKEGAYNVQFGKRQVLLLA